MEKGACILHLNFKLVALTFFWVSSLAIAEPKYKEGEVIIKLKNQSGLTKQAASKVVQGFQSKATKGLSLKSLGSYSSLNIHHMKLDNSNKSVEDTIASLQTMEEVEYAEPNWIVEKSDIGGVEGTLTAGQAEAMAVQAMAGGGFLMTSAQIQAMSAWAVLNAGSQPTVVAIIDTGVDDDHPSFNLALWTNTDEVAGNGVDDDRNGYIDDVHGWNFVRNNNNADDDEGHGTHVAGIVLGTAQNIFAMPLSAANVQIMPLKFLDHRGSGTTADAIKAVYYAANNGAKVMNNSWGGGSYSQALAEAITYSYNKDSVFIAAAGNARNNNDAAPVYPASYDMPNVVAVAASDDADILANFSNYGSHTVQISSPGVSILSTYPGGFFAYLSGTSMAAPFATGVVALMRYQSPSMNSYQVRQLLFQAVDTKATLSPYVSTSGRINVLKSVGKATNTAVNSYKPAYDLGASSANRGLAGAIASRGGGCGTIGLVGREHIFGKQGNNFKQFVILLALVLLPLALIQVLKTQKKGVNKRKFDRFAINSSVRFKLGDQELVGAVKTISVGGSDLNTDALLKDGSLITMAISSPDGNSRIEVQGHVVWSVESKRYGIQFVDVADSIKSQITEWSKGLTRA